MGSDEEEEEDMDKEEGVTNIVAYTIVEGEADEEEDDDAEVQEEPKQVRSITESLYPGLQLPPKYLSSGSADKHSTSESDGDNSEDYASLFSNSKFSFNNEESQDYYFTSELQRRVARQN